MMDLEMMMNELESARLASTEPNSFPVYALSNGHEIKWVRYYNYEAMKSYFEKRGFWVCSIFKNGHKCEV